MDKLKPELLANKPYVNPAIISRETRDGTLILVNSDNGCSISVNKTGKLVWNLLSQQKTDDEIINHLRNSFLNVPESFETEITNLISLLKAEGYIGYELS